MKHSPILASLLLVFGGLASSASEITTDLTPLWDTAAPLANPHKGWYHHYYDNGLAKYLPKTAEELTSFPGLDHLYLRFAWSYIEPEEGKFDWSLIDDMVAKWPPRGMGISLRISCKETGTSPVQQQFATPRWVMEAGAKGGYYRKGREPGNPKFPWEPRYDDPVYLAKLETFICALAARYDGKPWLRYIDIGSVGDWGEGHTSSGSKIRYGADVLRKHIDIHTRHFKKTQLVATDDYVRDTDGDHEPLHQHIVSEGITYRDDSILVDYWVGRHPKTFSVANPEFFEAVYRQTPTILETQHMRSWASNGSWTGKPGTTVAKFKQTAPELIKGAIRQMRATYIGYHGHARNWMALSNNPKLSNEMLNLCGYWFFPHRITYPSVLQNSEANTVTIDWENRGVAPAYQPYQIIFRLRGPETTTVTLDASNRSWLPGAKPTTTSYHLKLPKSLPAGSYTFAFRLHSPQTNRPVLLPLVPALKAPGHFCPVGEVEIR